MVPQLAADQPTRDSDTSYTISLREEATFHDGAPVTAEDVRYSYERPAAEDDHSKWALELIEEIRTPDEHTVEFRCALTRPVVPKEARESNPDAFVTDPDAFLYPSSVKTSRA